MYRYWVTRQKDGWDHSMRRELHRTDFIAIDDDYTGKFDAFNRVTWHDDVEAWCDDTIMGVNDPYKSFDEGAGYETYDITQVVLDSLESTRKTVTLLGKLTDETPTYTRLVRYNDDVNFDTTKNSRLVVVYGDDVGIGTVSIPSLTYRLTECASYTVTTLSGRRIGEVHSGATPIAAVLSGWAHGIYAVTRQTATGIIHTTHVWNGR